MSSGLQYINSLAKWKGKGDFSPKSIRYVLEALGNPQDKIKSIHVAGTNGKGSVCTFISSMLGASGAKVGLNISPHLHRINERVVIDGYPVGDEFFNIYGEKLKWACDKTKKTLGFHEAMTAVSFLGFEGEGVDYGVIEVGLGGRLDASNVLLKPEVCVIVNIGHDHEDILGIGLQNIAREKAGIIKAGVPCIVGDVSPEALEAIVDIAQEMPAPLFIFQKNYQYQQVSECMGIFESGEFQKMPFEVSLSGKHQLHNSAVSIMAGKILQLSDIDIKEGLKNAFWPARLESVEYRNKNILLDCAHNAEGVEALCTFLKEKGYQDLIIGFGALNDKNWRHMLKELSPFAKEFHLMEPLSDRAMPAEDIECELSCLGIKVSNYGHNFKDFISYINNLDSNSLILLTGSIYLVGELRSLLDIKERGLWKRI